MKKRLVTSIALLATYFIGSKWRAISQPSAPDWNEVLRSLQQKRNAVKGLKANYLFRYSISTETEQKYNKIGEETYKRAKANGDIKVDSPYQYEVYDRVATCRYQSKGPVYREDIGEAYPSLSQTRLLSHFRGFDGERYYSYDAERAYGVVGASATDTLSGSSRYQNVVNGISSLGVAEPANTLQEIKDSGLDFKFMNKEVANEEQCLKYRLSVDTSSGLLSRNTIWVSPSKSYSVVKWVSEVLRRLPGDRLNLMSVTIRNVFGMERVAPDIYLNKSYKEDSFEAEANGKLQWKNSYEFFLRDVELNPTLPASTFKIEFPPGTRVDNSIDNPGRLSVEGADPSFLAKSVSQGGKIKPETFDGSTASRVEPGEVFVKPTAP